MSRPNHPLLLTGLVALALTTLATAHEDDRKLLDRKPAYEGPGIRTGTPATLAGTGTGAGMSSTTPTGTTGVSGAGGGVQLAALNLGKNFPQSGIQLLSWMTLTELWEQDSASNCWGYTSPSGREYALLGLARGTGFVEITDPGNPQPIELIAGPYSTWHDVRTYGEYAYAVSEGGGGIHVIDLTQIDNGTVTYVKKILTGGTAATHTMTINEDSGYLYRSGGGSNGLRIYSLSDPLNPTFVGEWQSRYVHAATVVSYTSGPYAGKEIAFCCGGLNGGFNDTGLDILDVTNKSNIQYLSHSSYSAPGYSHQGWPSEDLKYFYLGDELNENGGNKTRTKVFDITDLSNPVELQEFKSSKRAIGHNIYVKGDLIFEANYTAGLRVFDATDPLNPVETKWFDTYPENNQGTFNGLWHVYPYFPSGLVIGSDTEKGLFVWWVGDPMISFAFPLGLPAHVDPAGDTVTVELTELSAGDHQEGTEQLHYNIAGAGWVSVPMSSAGGDNYEAALPATACGDEIEFYISAKSSNGFTWTEPAGAPGLTHLTTAAASVNVTHSFDMEMSGIGWSASAPDDDATNGKWIRGKPLGSAAQPGNDHTLPPGDKCWVTGNATIGLSPIENNVDNGKVTLRTASYDLTSHAEPVIGYWRWYSNHTTTAGATPYEDVFVIDVSNDGVNWVNVETLGPAGSVVTGGWQHHQFRVLDYVPLSPTIQVRFVASDYNNMSVVEAAIDDLEIFDVGCISAPASYCTAGSSAAGCQASLTSTGTPSASATSGFDLTATDAEGAKDGLFFFGANGRQANTWGSSTSYQCVVPPVIRAGLLSAVGSPGNCDGTFTQDLNALWCATCPRPLKNPGAGAVVQAQLWYRDPQSTSNQTTALSDAIEFAVQP